MNKSIKFIIVIVSYLSFFLLAFWMIDSVIFPNITSDRAIVTVPDIHGQSLSQAKRTLYKYDLDIEVVKELYSGKYKSGTIVSQSPQENSQVKSGRAVFVVISKGKQLVAVPYLAGLNARRAKLSLMRTGLEIGNISYDFSDDVAKDIVISQSIEPNKKIAYGEKINLIVSKGAEHQIKIPNLIGASIMEAKKILEESNLTLGTIDYRHEETYLPELIIEQHPLPGAAVAENTPVSIIVTK